MTCVYMGFVFTSMLVLLLIVFVPTAISGLIVTPFGVSMQYIDIMAAPETRYGSLY